MAADLRKSTHFARSRRVVLALAILFGLLAVAILPARRHVADALLVAHGDNVDALARSYAEQIVDPSFLAQVRPRIRPIDGHRLSDEAVRASISAHRMSSNKSRPVPDSLAIGCHAPRPATNGSTIWGLSQR